MSYAVRNDGAGWRAVGGPDDCAADETWQADQPPACEPDASAAASPEQKLAAFLAANPDVLQLAQGAA